MDLVQIKNIAVPYALKKSYAKEAGLSAKGAFYPAKRIAIFIN
jgi:hypothetical protein